MHSVCLSQSLALSKTLKKCPALLLLLLLWHLDHGIKMIVGQDREEPDWLWEFMVTPKASPKVARQPKPDCHREQLSLSSVTTDALYWLCFL